MSREWLKTFHRAVVNPFIFNLIQIITCGFIAAGVVRHWNAP